MLKRILMTSVFGLSLVGFLGCGGETATEPATDTTADVVIEEATIETPTEPATDETPAVTPEETPAP